jgi:hypothetical protein
MPPAGFERTIPAGVRPQTHALDSAATGIGYKLLYRHLSGETIEELALSVNKCFGIDLKQDLWSSEVMIWYESRGSHGGADSDYGVLGYDAV